MIKPLLLHQTQQSPTQPTPSQPITRQNTHFPYHLTNRPLHAIHSHGSDEGSLKLNELTNLVTKLSERIGVLEDDLRKTKKTYSSAFTKLILRVKKLEARVKIGKARKRLITETEPIIQEVTPTEVIQDQGSSEKGSAEVSTAGATKVLCSEVTVVSTAEENIKKSKKDIEQERLSFAKAIRLEEQMNEEQRAQIARDEEIARQWDEEERQRAMSEAKSTKKIDWNDPSVIRYHALKMKPKTIAQARRNMIKYLKNQGNYKISDFKGMSYNEIRPIFEKVWDFNQHIEPMEHGSEKMKSPEKIEEEDVDTQKEMKEVVKESGAKRKKSLPRKRSTNGIATVADRAEIPLSQETITKMLNKRLRIINQKKEDLIQKKIGIEYKSQVRGGLLVNKIYTRVNTAKYSKDTDMSLIAYSDAYHAGCQDTRRSTSGSAQFLGDKLVSWYSKKQKRTAISSTEADYIALSVCSTRKVRLLYAATTCTTLKQSTFVGIKSLLEVTTAQVRVTVAKQNLVLFSNLNEKYAK
ncbi:hypothetical protein Tco_0411155 [Tanacetum coccineum]